MPAELKKEFTLFRTVAVIVGTVIGSGIFLTPNQALDKLGSPAMLLVVFGLTGIWSLAAQLCYAELGTLIPESGAEYAFFKHAFKSGLPAFMFAVVSCVIVRPLALGIVSLTFARYAVLSFVGDCELYGWAIKSVAVALLVFVCTLNCLSVKWLARAQSVLFVLKLIAVLLISALGIAALSHKDQSFLASGFNGTSNSIGDIGLSFYGAQWAYFGWFEANYLTQELKDPSILVKAAIISMPLVILCYELVIMSYMAILPRAVFSVSETVAVEAGKEMIGAAALVVFPMIVAIACLGTANGSLLASSRLIHRAGIGGELPQVLALVHNTLLTPVMALLTQTLFAIVVTISIDLSSLIALLGFTADIIIAAAMVVLLLLRRWEPTGSRAIKVPLVLPFIVLIPALIFTVAPFIQYPLKTSATAIVILLMVPFYFGFVSRRFEVPIHPYLDRLSVWSVTVAKKHLDVS